jgi:glycosyltransferase involved in cell wall biosynthesis
MILLNTLLVKKDILCFVDLFLLKGFMIKIAILTNVIPVYRKGFYDELLKDTNLDVTVFCQSKVPGFNYQTIHQYYPDNIKLVKFIAAQKEKIVWQFLPWFNILRNYDVVFVDGNPRILSHALIATILDLLKRKVVVWSMVHSCWNKSFTENIRISWLKIFRNHFVYNDKEVLLLKEKGFINRLIIGMNNGLDQKAIDDIVLRWNHERLINWQYAHNLQNENIIISSGRLFNGKFDIIVEVIALAKQNGKEILWICVGDGPAKEDLVLKSKVQNIADHVHFVGEMYDNEALAPYFLSAKVFVHPTAVGLSIMHAFGFGLPIITHDLAAEHGPEYVAFEDGLNGFEYKQGDASDMLDKVNKLLEDELLRSKMSMNAKKQVQEKYNTDVMCERFVKMVTEVYHNRI